MDRYKKKKKMDELMKNKIWIDIKKKDELMKNKI